MPVLIGTSGWQYRDWRGRFYPPGLAQARWLEHYADRFRVVEVNNAFYRLPESGTFAAWAARTPPDFVVGVKVSRYLTHVKRLREPAEPVARFLDRARHLGSKLGPVLLQLPPTAAANLGALDETLELFGGGVRVAVEFRHDSWFTEDCRRALERRGAALCWADRAGAPIAPTWRTAPWGYLRLHDGGARPWPCYEESVLDAWAGRLAAAYGADDDVYAFFNNDPGCCAVSDAIVFAGCVASRGLAPTRVPRPVDVAAGSLPG